MMKSRILTVLAVLGISAAIGTLVTAASMTTTAYAALGDHGRPSSCEGNPHFFDESGNPHHPPTDEGNPHFCPGPLDD
jgi:hypothetical protein